MDKEEKPHLYFWLNETANIIKIGQTKSILKRMKNFKSVCETMGCEFKLLHIVEISIDLTFAENELIEFVSNILLPVKTKREFFYYEKDKKDEIISFMNQLKIKEQITENNLLKKCAGCLKIKERKFFPIISKKIKGWCLDCYKNKLNKAPDEIEKSRKEVRKKRYSKETKSFLKNIESTLDYQVENILQKQLTPIIKTKEVSDKELDKLRLDEDEKKSLETTWNQL